MTKSLETPRSTNIDIWHYDLNISFPAARSLLSPAERDRADKYYFQRHQRRFTIARAMLRSILARYTGISPKLLTFSENKYGKPHLPDYPWLSFNLSHSDDHAVLAVGKDHAQGIDVECFKARPYLGIGQHSFSDKENEALLASQPMLRPLRFFHIWTQKEALIKACGMGLSYPTKTFDVSTDFAAHATIQDSLHNKTWRMLSFTLQMGALVALCYPDEVETIRYRKNVMPDDLSKPNRDNCLSLIHTQDTWKC